MSYTARRQDAIEYNELSLRCLPGHILRKNYERVYVGEYVVITDRRPNPNAAQSGSLTSGLSFPFFRNRSGWNSSGLSKVLGSCNIDLNEEFRTENRMKWSYQPCVTDYNCPFRNIEAIIFIVHSRRVGNNFETRQDGSNDDDYKRPTGYY